MSVENAPIPKRLGRICTSLQALSTNAEADADFVKKELALIVKQLDDIIQSIKAESFSIAQHEQAKALESDLERELGRVRQPIKPNIDKDPRRID